MHRKVIFCAPILFAVAAQPLMAQTLSSKPSPKPSPLPTKPELGSREYTQAAVLTVLKAASNYRDVCNRGDPKLEDVEKAYKSVHNAQFELSLAFLAEYKNIPEIREQEALTESLWHAAEQLHKTGKDYEAEIKADNAYLKAQDKLDDMQWKHGSSILAVVDPDKSLNHASDYCETHKDLLKAKAEAEEKRKEEMRKEMDAAARELIRKADTAPPKKTDDCNKGGGLPGPLEKLACQESK